MNEDQPTNPQAPGEAYHPQPIQQPLQTDAGPEPIQQPSEPVFVAPQPAEINQPQPAQQPIQATQTSSTEYNSNPFIVAGKGLGSALTENPTSAILLALIPIFVIFPALLIMGIVVGLLSLAGGVVGGLLGALVALVVIIAIALLLIRVAAGSLNIVLRSLDKERISTKEALGSISSGKLTSFVIANTLAFIAIFVGFLFFILPGIYLLARLSLAPVIVYAEDKKAIAALKRSMALTKGHVFEMLGALSAQSLLSGNGLLSTIGASSGVVKRYKELSVAESSGITDTGKVHWLNYVMPFLMAVFLVGYVAVSIFSSMVNQSSNNLNNFNDFNNGLYMNDDFRFDNSDFNDNLGGQDDFNSNFEFDYSN